MVFCLSDEHLPFKGSQVINEYLIFVLCRQMLGVQSNDQTMMIKQIVGGSFLCHSD